MKKYAVVVILLLVVLLLVGCSAKEQVRLSGTKTLGLLPSDMSYDMNGLPNIITISTESDGDILMSYLNTNSEVVVQMYGCPFISVTCANLEVQGKYVWQIP